MKFDKILAKSSPEETLIEHTRNALIIWREAKERYYRYYPDDDFWKDSFIALLFHDFGKVASNFQRQIRSKGKLPGNYLRHEFISGMFLFLNQPMRFTERPHSLFSVFSHHKALRPDLFSKEVDLEVLEESCNPFLEDARRIYTEEWGEELDISNKTIKGLQQKYQALLAFFQKRIRNELLPKLSKDDRQVYIWHKAILHECDWAASGGLKSLPIGITYNKEDLNTSIVTKLVSDGKIENPSIFTWRQFQLKSWEFREENVIAIAPTGSGKTEASLLWASGKEAHNRILYLLPTRVTSNAIFRRLSEYFPNGDNVAVVHSSALFFRKDIDDTDYDKKKYLWDKTFFKNITVCTVDQVLTPGFNLGHWELKTFHSLEARIIVDEIHLYAPYTLALLIRTIEYLKSNFNAKFYLMTATMPSKLKSILAKTLGSPIIIEDTELLSRARNIIETRDMEVDRLIPEIENLMRSHPKTKLLLVVNTVDQAIQLYENFQKLAGELNLTLLCYHSRFIQKDRIEKEKEIFEFERSTQGGILVATQVVEVSLDIDFDILYTENAPIDALIQRAGRVNRKGIKENTKVIVFKHKEISEKIYEVADILNSTFSELKKYSGQKISEQTFINLVDRVYDNYEVEREKGYEEGYFKYNDIQQSHNFIQDLSADDKVFTREGLDTVTVIPDAFMEDLWNSEDFEKKEKHTLSIRRKRLFSLRRNTDNQGYVFVSGRYSDKTGFSPYFDDSRPASNQAKFA